MRSVPSYISERLKRNIQTRANDSAPSVDIWVGRPSTLLVDDKFLERQTVLQTKVSDVSIAVCHPRIKRNNTHIYMAYISGGVARVVAAKHKTKMAEHEWYDSGFEQNATAVSIAYDGTMPKANGGDVEFVTELYPWVFWVDETVLYGQKLYSDEESVILAETNCTDVSAIRAMWSSTGGFDFGLVVFFILEGKLYYRQLIDGEWMDAELVSFGPDGVTWQEVAAFRTWDYRIGVQAKSTDGDVYELFTQFMGVGKQNTEHIEVKNVEAESTMTHVTYHNTKEAEHVELSEVASTAPYGGLYSLDMPVLVSARNVEAEDGDWGKIVVVEFSNYLVADQVASNYLQFALVDSWGAAYYPASAVLGSDGKTVTLTFVDFNPAYDVCEIRYTPGSVYSMATVQVEATSVAFTPENLNPPDIPQPEVESIWNVDSQGTEMAIQFTEAIVGNPSGNEAKFTIVTQEYGWVPGGTLSEKNKKVVGAKGYASSEELIDLSSGSASGISAANGRLSLEVLSDG